ncbi:MAG: ABC transporter permease [Anaerolineales bacterium]|jgi:peptide/nickel transport system permease protein|nr:ABC transporter permease [Anaerolineales bacterium]MBK8823762.1 ABC transporter permease [Anaerolineales bacterium]
MIAFRKSLKDLMQYPSAIAGMIMIFGFLAVSVYAMTSIPYNEAIRLWRGGEGVWYKNPVAAPPAWTNYFRSEKLPESIVLSSSEGSAEKIITDKGDGISETLLTYTFDYSFDAFPKELAVYFTSTFTAKEPYVSILWITPDGREIRIADTAIGSTDTLYFSQDAKLQRRLGGEDPAEGLFLLPENDSRLAQRGLYTLRISALTFEPDSVIDADFVLYGQVHGWAGTDHQRRDLSVALLWGMPVALAFGLLAAFGTTIITMIIAAVGSWFGGWLDELIQRLTEISLVLPFLPILIMVGTFYSRSIWVILSVTILLNIFSGQIKAYRAIFLQVRESPYIEAARSYGASQWRIIFRYLIPRIIPILIPQLVTVIPAFVFLEASLAVLGLGDPVLPTWGKVIDDARANGALFQGQYYWVLEPSVLLMLTGLAFAMLGYSLDRIFNPRLRGV